MDAALRDPAAGLIREQRSVRGQVFAALLLPPPESSQLLNEPVRQEHVRGPAALGDRGPDTDPHPRRTVRREHIADVEAHDFGQPKAGAESQGDDQVVAKVDLRDAQDGPLFVDRERGRGEVRHPHRFARWGRKSRPRCPRV